MAEFKLGRIKFVWKSAWTAATTYYVDDVVRHGGKTFICVVGHVADSNFYTDLSNVPTKWNQFTDGQDWKGNWSNSQLYKVNDIVKYGGATYVCNTPHTSQATLELDQSKWDLFVNGFDWTGDWTVNTTYKVNDVVNYGGIVYICQTAHTSSSSLGSGLEANLSDWDMFSEGLNWIGDWAVSTRYKRNDIVKYGGYAYVCNTGHTSSGSIAGGLEADQGNWDHFHKGIDYKGTWSGASVRYKENDLVKFGANIYRCNLAHTSTTTFDDVKFELFVEGFEFTGEWNIGTAYRLGDIVNYGGYQYVSKTSNLNQVPSTSTANWDIFTTNYKFIGDYSNVLNYRVGDVVRHGGYTYTAIADNIGTLPTVTGSWTRLNSGLRWRNEWANSTSYLLGDIVSFGKFSYICVQAHTSDDDDSTITPTVNSPQKDVNFEYWNILTTGLEESVLNTKGDVIYFGTGGARALSIGLEGQVLTVVDGLPAWTTWGKTEEVFYVGPTGIDDAYPVQGATLDKPWKTVRWATEQLEAGVYRPNSAYLLRQNRTFIQKEIVEWIDYQIANNIGIFNGFVNPSKATCERDMGLIVDAIVYDISHGGNVKTIDAANSYFNLGVVSYIVGEEAQTVAAINYGISVIQSILVNIAPSQNYQTLNGISAGDRIKQIINFNYSAESDSYALISSLAKVITDVITAGSLTNIPATRTPGYTIFVKTGLFEEVLPIILPADTAIVGDELRSTKISPAGKLIASSDKAKSLATLAHLRTITDDVIQNLAVSPTVGNSVIQDRTSQKAGDVGSTLALNSVIANAAEIKDIIANNTPNAYVYPAPTNWGTSLVNTAYASTGFPTGNTSGFDDGRRLLLANKAFLQNEVSTWILAQIAGNVAPFVGFTYGGTRQSKCERDVGLIIDAIIYDMTYGGNLATQIAARSYYSLGAFVEPAEEKAPALAVQNRIKDIIDNIIIGNTAGWTKTTLLVQDVSGTAGSSDAGAFAQDRIQQIYNTINTGTEPVTSLPFTSWVSSELQTARTTINGTKAEVQADAIQYVKRTFPTLNFDEALCSRDVGYIVDALGYDLMFGSNFLSIQNGLSYRRGTASTQVVLTQQLDAQLAIIDFISLKVSEIATSGAVIFADLLWSYIIGIITAEALPVNTGRNTPTINLNMINGANILRLNADFFAAEATAYANNTFRATVSSADGGTETFTCSSQTWMVAGDTVRFSGTVFGNVNTTTTYYVLSAGLTATTFRVSLTPGGTPVNLSAASGSMTVTWYYDAARCQNDVRNYINAIANDMTYTGNYYVTLASRYYLRALRGSKLEDMYYVRNGCGIRNQTLLGLDGSSDGNTTGINPDGLSAPNAFGTRRPLAGAYVSLDPGWGPNDRRAWITTKSTYVQNVTTFGIGATGQKIDGVLHAGGNDSIVSNDFTQVISNGIGAWVTNLGRAELVSVFSYYAHIGYLAENGGKIRATNGNNSYGDFGSVAEGVDPTETAISGKVNNRAQEANIGNVITNSSNVLLLEYENAGSEYTSATYTISGGGSGADIVGNETRDGGIFNVRMTDPGDSSGPGGQAYVTASNVAQSGNTTQITLAATDTALSSAYVGMGIWIINGTGAGQYGYIHSYNSGNKRAEIRKPSTGTAGWDHVVAGTTIAPALDLTTIYEIVPRLTFAEPLSSKALRSGLGARDWKDVVYGNGTGSYSLLSASTVGTGLNAQFNVTRREGSYTVTIGSGGILYSVGDILTINGSAVGGATPANNISITVTAVDEFTGEIIYIESSGTAISQQWVAVASGTNQASTSTDGITWTARTLPATQDWVSVAYGTVNGIGYYVAVARQSATTAYSTNGIDWTSSSIGVGEEWDWCGVAYGNGVFVTVAESDSSTTRRARSTDGGQTWGVGGISTGAVSITHGQGRFVIVEGNFSNSTAYSADGITWVTRTLPANNDSTESNWRDVAHGNGRFVAIADNDSQVAISIDRGVTWFAARLPVSADWKKVSYGNGIFLAFAEGDIAASSPDGIIWTSRNFQATDLDILSTSKDRVVTWAASTSLVSDTWGAMVHGGGLYVALAFDGGATSPAAATSINGVTWSNATFPAGTTGDVRSIAFGDGWYVVPQAQSQRIYYSQNGTTFTFAGVNSLGVSADWCEISFGNGRFVTVAFGSNVSRWITSASLTSSPTTAWTVGGTLTATAEWTAGTFGNNRFVIISGSTSDSNVVNYSTDGTSWLATTMPSADRWSSVTFGNNRFVAVAGNTGTSTTKAAYSLNGITWIASTLPGAAARWTNVSWNGSVFVATAYGTNRSAISEDGITWTERAMASTVNWTTSASNTSEFKTAVLATGSGTTNLLEYEANTNLITVFSTSQLAIGDYIVIPNDSAGIEQFGGLATDIRYFIRTIYDSTRFTISTTTGGSAVVLTTGSGSMYATVNKVWSALSYGNGAGNAGFVVLGVNNPTALQVFVGAPARGRPVILDNAISKIYIHEPGSNYNSASPPVMTITDPNNTGPDATFDIRISNGVLGQPNYINRGTGFTSASASLTGDGYADNFQVSAFVEFNDLSDIPRGGSNLQINGIDDLYYKIVNVRRLTITGANTYSAQIQLSPGIGAAEAPEHDTPISIRSRFSQVRLTGHDFLDIGTGDKVETNYPGLPLQAPIPAREVVQSNGGRVFWTSTDQDGNFRVGGLFNVEQATGTATLNAEAFNLAGLNELSLGSVALGGGGATVSEFSADPFFTADSDSVIPTQRAIKAYISSQIGGGSGSLNVNTITAGQIFIAGNTISSTINGVININTTVNFVGGVDGYPVALNLFLQA
jgi:hypothetical protein